MAMPPRCPAELVEAVARISSECETVWRQARPANDFAAVRPLLEEMLRLQREVASAKAAALGVEPFEALLDRYEPGGTSGDDRPPVRRTRRLSCPS